MAGEKFITTEALGRSGEKGESQVWDIVKNFFAERTCVAYWRYPIFSQVGKTRKEPDILIADLELGLIIIEVKSIKIEQLVAIQGHRWQLKKFYARSINPYEQAENQLFALLGYCDREPILRKKVEGRTLVALPLITQEQWQNKGFDQLPSCPPILFQDYLNSLFIEQIKQTPPIIKGKKLTEKQWKILLAVLGGTPVFRKPFRKLYPLLPPTPGSRAWVLDRAREQLSQLDLQQEQIGKQIPPGLQRIRGIAGSGKTVLLCQKAANMHLKHPEWNIALVFFSRSLYHPITTQLDKWLRRFSSNEVQYSPTNPKLKVLHAWGGKNQPGLYSTICEAAGVHPLTVYDSQRQQPHEALAELCRQLLQSAVIPQCFDAILIDEGQDLMVSESLKFQGKQPIYWLAYQALQPVDAQTPQQRRLIWAYDEAQSLESFKIPTASEIFGDELAHLVTGYYPGEIKKSEFIHRCYRTPSPIIAAAHALGMGLLRPGGMVSGMTRIPDWQAMGYEVQGCFSRGEKVTLRRIAEASLNPIPQLWGKPVLEFEIYRDRKSELTALAARLLYNLKEDGLQPSQEILVIVLGSFYQAAKLETEVAEFLISQGINTFIPGATECNVVEPENREPNKFWCDGGVTVSRIHRAKGNEADMVYIIGLDNIAQDERNLMLRNQLFVALTRARGWVQLSGVGNYPFYTEVRQVIESGDTFTFIYKHPPRRKFSVTDAGELLTRYAAGDRNFQASDLRGIQLAGADLRNANLIRAQLSHADLSGACLDGAKLAIADLSYAQLTGASLRKAKLMGATLRNANLTNADLSYADLSHADLTDAQICGANLSGANLEMTELT